MDTFPCKCEPGIVSHVGGYFGPVEPQMRGSLHIHLLLHVIGFTSPQELLRRFRGARASLENNLWAWVRSISFTSIEALAGHLGLPDRHAALAELQPFPYTDWQVTASTAGRPDHADYVECHGSR